ncbi:signal transduction histidine kinase [Nakamurella sp. UYEF19]|uniref:sensor histidine kinase n=1 Tax=Nakamurella sp. UYEF19 TaxID=1756392 RepID=UPI0033951ABD
MRRRIIRLSTAVTAVAILLFGLPLAIGLTRYFISEQHRSLHDAAAGIAVAVSGDQGLRQLPTDANAEAARQFAVYDPIGTKIAGDAPAASGPLVDAALRGGVVDGQVDGRYAVAVPVTDGNTVVGAVLATQSDALLSTPVAVTWIAMTALALMALIVSWLLGRRQARVLTRPLEDLAGVAERLGDGDFGVRTVPAGMTEIDSLNRSINRTAVRLGELLDRERTYTADASHQLRTPLTGLRFQLEAALEDSTTDPRQAIRDALVTTDRLEATITDLLALARDTPSTGEPLDIDSLVRDVHERWRGALAQQGRPVQTVVARLDGASRASAAAVSQILDVLLDNACRHGDGEVLVTVRDAIDTIAIDVTNQGPIIAGGGRELFRRRTGGSTGHGIGLALARSLAHAEGGRLTLSADTPTFTLLLPAPKESDRKPALK